MANFMTDFKPTGGDWLSAIAKILGSGSEYAGSMEKRKKDELFRKALAEMGNKEGWLPETQEDANAVPSQYKPREIMKGPQLDEQGYPAGYPQEAKLSQGLGPVNPSTTKFNSPMYQQPETVGLEPNQYPQKLEDTSKQRYSGMNADALLKLYAMRDMPSTDEEGSSGRMDNSLYTQLGTTLRDPSLLEKLTDPSVRATQELAAKDFNRESRKRGASGDIFISKNTYEAQDKLLWKTYMMNQGVTDQAQLSNKKYAEWKNTVGANSYQEWKSNQ